MQSTGLYPRNQNRPGKIWWMPARPTTEKKYKP